MAENKERLLLFDLLRITGILLVVLCHIGIFCGYSLLSNCVNIFDIFFIGAGPVGVGIFLLVSGSVLEYNHGDIKLEKYFEFVKKRLLRVYPAYWMSLIFASLFVSFVYSLSSAWDIVISYSGFMAFTGKWGGPISNAGWFIGLIVSLYLCYPFITRWMKEHPYATIIAMVLVSLVSRYIIISYNVGDESMWRWFPLCNLIWFSFGIFIVRMGLFPRTMNKLGFIRVLSDMSFYMFLLNFMIIDLAVENLFMYIIVLLMLSWMFLLADNRMQKMLKSITLSTLTLKNLERYARRNIYQLVAVEIVFLLLIGSMVLVVKPMIEHDNGIKVKQLFQESYNDTVASYQNLSSYGAFNGSSVGSFKIWMDEYCERTNNMYINLHHMRAYGDLYKPYADFYEQKNIEVNISLYYGLANESMVKAQVYKIAYDSWYWNGTQPIGFQ